MGNTTEYKRLTKWKKEPQYTDLVKDREEADSSHNVFLGNLEEYRVTRSGGKKIVTRKNKSNVRPLLVRKQNEWKYPALEEPFLSTDDMFKIRPRTAEDEASAQQNQLMLNYYWATKVDKVSLVGEVVRTVVDEGTVIVKTGWNSEWKDVKKKVKKPIFGTPEQSYNVIHGLIANGKVSPEEGQALIETGEPMPIGFKEEVVTEQKLVANHPVYEVCVNENVIVDPTCQGNLSKAQFVIHEFETDLSTLKNDEYDKESNTGFYKNLDLIDFTIDRRDLDNNTGSEAKSIASTFEFADKARKKVKVSEYWGYWDIDGKGKTTAIVATWVGKVMIRMERNPFAHQKIPFSSTTYMPKRKEFHGEPDAALLKENQESIGRMTRAYHDITTTKAIGQKITRDDLFNGPAEWDAFERGNDARSNPGVDPRNAIYQMNVESIDPSVFQVIQMQQQDAESLTATKAFNTGISGNALGASATGIRSAMDATSKRELSILRRISTELFQHMARLTVINMQAYASEEETVRITSNEFITVRREDLQGEFDLIIDISTPESDAEKAQQLTMLLQTSNANMDPKLSAMVLGKIMRLWKMPDTAKQVEEFKPEPNPQQEKLVAMKLENARLENELLKSKVLQNAKSMEDIDSKINERGSRALENEVDRYLKAARAEEMKARAEKLQSETDAIDLQFLHKHDGTDRKAQIEDLVYREDSKLEGIRAKALDKLNVASSKSQPQTNQTGEQ